MTPPPFSNDDSKLRAEAARIREERHACGLEGQVGGLEAVIIATELEQLEPATEELLATTGYDVQEAFEDECCRTCVLSLPGSADILLRGRKGGDDPFAAINLHPKTQALPHTRLETLVFAASDLERYAAIQRGRGVRFLTPEIERHDASDFLQTRPSPYTGNSIGFIEWHGERRSYADATARRLDWHLPKSARRHLRNVGLLDHLATRVTAEHRDPAILEFLSLTNYDFEFAIYVPTLNSITNVARMQGQPFAYVFTSGIHAPASGTEAGPTEKFVENYGARVHHVAFATERIEETFRSLCDDGMRFLTELVGSPEEGLKQTFSEPSRHTMLVTEYLHRYGGFTGFFTKSNVTMLTAATADQ